MREIKFRAWNTKRKELVYGVDVYDGGSAFEGNNDNPYDFDEKTLCQFTGLKDKNGKEIYEGDLLLNKWCGNSHGKPVKVFFEDGRFCFTGSGCDDCDSYLGNHLLEDFEVIGNIYENPELLKEKV